MAEVYIALLCGDREWSDVRPIIREIKRLIRLHGTTHLLILVGGARGADSLSKLAAHGLNVHVAEIEALWSTRRKSAGSQRNKMMRELEPNEVICFHNNIEQSKGTKSMKELAEEWNIPVKVVKSQ